MRSLQLWFVICIYRLSCIQHHKHNLESLDSLSDRATKIIVTPLFNDGIEKRKIPMEAVYALFWDIIFFLLY